MTRALVLRDLPSPTPQLAASLTPSEYERHSAEIEASVRACLGNYWQAPDDPKADALRMADWIAALEDWPIADIQDALRQWVMDKPSKRPNFGHIAATLKQKRAEELLRGMSAPEPEPQRERVSKEAADEIMRAAGYAPRRMTEASE